MSLTQNSIDHYFSKISRHPLLTPTEEIECGRKIQAMMQLVRQGKDPALFSFSEKQIWRSGERAKKRMIEANLRLVVKVSGKYYARVNRRTGTSGMDQMDIIQAGNMGLIKAVERFEPDKGYKFSTYAYWWIKQQIGRDIANQERTIRMPENMHQLMRKISTESQKFECKNGRCPTLAELSQITKTEPHNIENAIRFSIRVRSLDAPAGGVEDTNGLHDVIADNNSWTENSINLTSQYDLHAVLYTLDERERDIVCLRHGLLGREEITFGEISKKYNICSERVRQIYSKSLRKIRLRLSFPGLHSNAEIKAA